MTKFSGSPSLVTFIIILFPFSGVRGLKVPFERRAPRGASVKVSAHTGDTRYALGPSTAAETLHNREDVRYVANITINGKEVPVALDTGSTDLWVNPPGGIGTFNDTKIPINMGYGDGSYGASGTIGVSPFKFGTYEVSKQAFAHVTNSTISGLEELGVYGLLGLGFDLTSASLVKAIVQQKYGNSTTWGNSVLYNIFDQNPCQPDVIAMRLSRTDDLEDTKGGSFTIGEYDPDYTDVTKSPKLAQYPEGGSRWTTLLEGICVDGKSIPLTSAIEGVPAGRVQPMLDTGVPTALFLAPLWDAIYSSIPGAVKYNKNYWLVPCNTTTVVQLEFGGKKYPIHPLDLTRIGKPYNVNGRNVFSCFSAFEVLPDHWVKEGYEILLGDSFLRNVYSAYNFGDSSSSGKPYMQLLSTVDTKKAVSQVNTIRRRTMADLPPELPPAEVVRLLKPSVTSTGFTGPASAAAPSEHRKGSIKAAISGSAAEDNSLYTTYGIGAEDLKKYGLIALCLLGTNVLIGLILLVVFVFNWVRRGSAFGGRGCRARVMGVSTPYVPVKRQEDGSDSASYPTRYGDYQ